MEEAAVSPASDWLRPWVRTHSTPWSYYRPIITPCSTPLCCTYDIYLLHGCRVSGGIIVSAPLWCSEMHYDSMLKAANHLRPSCTHLIATKPFKSANFDPFALVCIHLSSWNFFVNNKFTNFNPLKTIEGLGFTKGHKDIWSLLLPKILFFS